MWIDQSEHQCSHVLNIYENTQNPPTNKGNLYLCSVDFLDNADLMKNLEIDCVLSVVDRLTYNTLKIKDLLRTYKIKHSKWIDLENYDSNCINPHLDDIHSYIRSMIKEHNVLVHCQTETARSSFLVIAQLMKEKKMDFHEAHIYAKSKRGIVKPKAELNKKLKNFEGYLKKNHHSMFMRCHR